MLFGAGHRQSSPNVSDITLRNRHPSDCHHIAGRAAPIVSEPSKSDWRSSSGSRRRPMKTRMLSSLAIAALATVTLNSSEVLAKGAGGSGGVRSFSAMRTSPVVIKQFKTVTPTTVKKLTTTTVVRDHRKPLTTTTATTEVRDHRTKDVIVRDHRTGTDSNVIVRDHRTLDPSKLPGGVSVTPTPGGTIHLPPSGAPGGVSVTPTPGGTIHLPPSGTVPPPINTPPVVTIPPKVPPVIGPPVVVNPPAPPAPPPPPPVVVNPP